jgi:hypothetical protein
MRLGAVIKKGCASHSCETTRFLFVARKAIIPTDGGMNFPFGAATCRRRS